MLKLSRELYLLIVSISTGLFRLVQLFGAIVLCVVSLARVTDTYTVLSTSGGCYVYAMIRRILSRLDLCSLGD